jgi:hypothetical protein
LYFDGEKIRGAFEYEADKIIVAVNGSSNISFINRNKKKEETEFRITNISGENNFCCLQPFPNFNINSNPYVLIRD